MTTADRIAPVWVVAPRVGAEESQQLQSDSLLQAQLLWNRGIRTSQEAHAFLESPSLESLGDPLTMRGMIPAIERLRTAILRNERIAIYGDYDVDGIAGAALLASAIGQVGGEVQVHVPDRARDGYGVNVQAVQQLAMAGTKVMITVDCGISASAEIAVATEMGMDVIVTDHHRVPTSLPKAWAVLNPHHSECCYPFKDLAGGGVAFQLARALLASLHSGSPAALAAQLETLATFATMSTIADVVPLLRENRTIARIGLAASHASEHAGLVALCQVAGKSLSRLTAHDLGFSLIPRLNAAGRMGDARRALDLLLATDAELARDLAIEIDHANTERRDRVAGILTEVENALALGPLESSVMLVGDYPAGLAGLIAGRVTERHGVPCAVVERGAVQSRGSVRGTEDVDLMKVLEACAPTLVQFGGHARAAGFTIASTEIETFRAEFDRAVRRLRSDTPKIVSLHADGILSLSSIGPRLADLLEQFEPVGAGNERPVFVSRRVLIRSVRELNGGHVSMQLAQGPDMRRAVAFNPQFTVPVSGTLADILYEVERSHWGGEERVELIVRDLRPLMRANSDRAGSGLGSRRAD